MKKKKGRTTRLAEDGERNPGVHLYLLQRISRGGDPFTMFRGKKKRKGGEASRTLPSSCGRKKPHKDRLGDLKSQGALRQATSISTSPKRRVRILPSFAEGGGKKNPAKENKRICPPYVRNDRDAENKKLFA